MKKSGLKSIFYSFRYAISGLMALLKNEYNSRIHLIAATLATLMGIFFHIGITEWVILFIVIGLVFISELMNSAIEIIADMIYPETNPKIKLIKDYGAGGVLLSAVTAVLAGALIFVPKIIEAFR